MAACRIGRVAGWLEDPPWQSYAPWLRGFWPTRRQRPRPRSWCKPRGGHWLPSPHLPRFGAVLDVCRYLYSRQTAGLPSRRRQLEGRQACRSRRTECQRPGPGGLWFEGGLPGDSPNGLGGCAPIEFRNNKSTQLSRCASDADHEVILTRFVECRP